MSTDRKTGFNKLLIAVNSLIPVVMMCWDAYQHKLGANPVEFIIHTTGILTLIFLMLTLSITPLRKTINRPILIRYRRILGLFAFFYACLHLFSYLWFDKSFQLSKILADIANRQFIAIGMICFLLLLPLAITSTNSMVKRLGGQRWVKLHKLVYYISIGGLIHYWLSVKADTDGPTIFGIVLIILLGYRYFTTRLEQSSVNSIKISNK
ncbi:MAG: sulfoxide reductase heme-binding subunit YedZ [Blastocatellia bacterium]|nr:sulfoxide reductase heme-binding subunit YedZ [Blastocatellia bacterium]